MHRRLLDFHPDPFPPRHGGLLRDEADELEHATGLLEAQSTDRLPRYLATLIAAAGPAGRAALRGATGPVLLSVLRQVVRLATPRGSSDLRHKAATIFGLELEGLSPEDKEFELARHLVRLLRAVIEAALAAGPCEPVGRVHTALGLAARRHAPGLLKRAARMPPRRR